MHEQLVASVYRDFPASRGRIRAMIGRCDFRRLPGDIQKRLGAFCGGHRMSLILTLLQRRVRLLERAIFNH